MGIGNLLKKAASKNADTKAKKSSMPVIELPDTEELREAVNEYREAKEKEKNAKAKAETNAATLREESSKEMKAFCLKEGKAFSSVKVQVGKLTPLTFVVQNKYSKIDPKQAKELEKLFGDKFEKYFTQKTEISLSDAAMAKMDEILPMVVSAFGGKRLPVAEYLLEEAKKELKKAKTKAPIEKKIAHLEAEIATLQEKAEETFLEYMAVKQYHEVKDALHNDRMTDAAVQALADKAIGKTWIKPQTPSLRV